MYISIWIHSILVAVISLFFMLLCLTDDNKMTEESKVREYDDLKRMEEYCQNTKECRRKQLLTYFGGVDIEANKCLPNSEAICDNCEIANVSKQLYFNMTLATKPVCRCQYWIRAPFLPCATERKGDECQGGGRRRNDMIVHLQVWRKWSWVPRQVLMLPAGTQASVPSLSSRVQTNQQPFLKPAE